MRLIDADELKLCYTGSDANKASYLSIRKMIDISKTTYDIDKVVEELEKTKTINVDVGFGTIYKTIRKDVAIEIVKQGGVSDDVCEWRFEETNGIAWHCDDKCTTYNQVYIKDLKITLEDFECKCPYCGKKIKVVK